MLFNSIKKEKSKKKKNKKEKGSGLHIAQIQLATEGVDVSFQSVIFL